VSVSSVKRPFEYADLLRIRFRSPLDEQEFRYDLIDGGEGQFASLGLGFFSWANECYVNWCPSVGAARLLLGRGRQPKVDLSKWEFALPPPEFFGPDRDHLDVDSVEAWERTRGFRGQVRHGTFMWTEFEHYDLQLPDQEYYWAFARDPLKAQFVGTCWIQCGLDFLSTGRTSASPPLESPVVQREDEPDVLVEVGRVLEGLGMWPDAVFGVLGSVAEFSGDADGGVLWWSADGEYLGDQGVEEFLEGMTCSLALVGVDLVVERLSGLAGPGSEYRVGINGEEVRLYGLNRRGNPDTWNTWGVCTTKPLTVVNRLLMEAGSVFRVGVLEPGGNDALALLLPEEMWKGLFRSGVFKGVTVKFPGMKRPR
jgi:hypothetical protein